MPTKSRNKGAPRKMLSAKPLPKLTPRIQLAYPPGDGNTIQDQEDMKDEAKVIEESSSDIITVSRLQTLPPELRERIWKYVVVKQSVIKPALLYQQETIANDNPRFIYIRNNKRGPNFSAMDLMPETTPLAVGRTCRSISQEVYRIYYTYNSFTLGYMYEAALFLSRIGFTHRLYLRAMKLVWSRGSDRGDLFKLLQDCVFLRKVDIELFSWSFPWRPNNKFERLQYQSELQKLRLVNPQLFELSLLPTTTYRFRSEVWNNKDWSLLWKEVSSKIRANTAVAPTVVAKKVVAIDSQARRRATLRPRLRKNRDESYLLQATLALLFWRQRNTLA